MKPPEAHTGWAWGFAFRGRRVATPAPLPCASKKSPETRDALDSSGPGVRPAPRAGRGPSLPSADGGASDPSETPTVLSHREIRRVGVGGYTRSRMPQNLRPSVRERLGSFQKSSEEDRPRGGIPPTQGLYKSRRSYAVVMLFQNASAFSPRVAFDQQDGQ